MSVIISRGEHFLGVPLVKVRNVLNAWRYGGSSDAAVISTRKNVDLDPRTVMVLLDELRDRGLLGQEEREHDAIDGLTEAGKALAFATARQRTSKARGWKAVDALIARVEAINARDDVPFQIDSVWIFGSLIDPKKPDIADVDVAIERSGSPRFCDDLIKSYRLLERELRGKGAQPLGFLHSLGFVEHHLLYGERRDPMLSPTDTGELQRLGCHCQQVYDLASGGRVDRPALPRHPQSLGRLNTVAAQRSKPDLTAARRDIQPVLCWLADPWRFDRASTERVMPWPEDSWQESFAFHNRFGLQIAERERPYPRRMVENAAYKRLDRSGCDGRFRSSVISTETHHLPGERLGSWVSIDAGVVFERRFNETPDGIVYRLALCAAEAPRHRLYTNNAMPIVWWLFVLMSADVERWVRREAEMPTGRALRVEVLDECGTQESAQIYEELVDVVSDLVDATRKRCGMASGSNSNFKPSHLP